MNDQRKALLQKLWIAAWKQGKVTIPCNSKAEQARLRFELYNAVKKVKERPELDQELAEAVRECSIKQPTPTMLVIEKRELEADLVALAEELGIDWQNLQAAPETMAEVQARESERRMKERMEQEAAVAAKATKFVNPYADDGEN